MLSFNGKSRLAFLKSFPLPNFFTLASFGNMSKKFGEEAIKNQEKAWRYLKKQGLNQDKEIALFPSKVPGVIVTPEPGLLRPQTVIGNAVITAEEGSVLSLFPADCYPILLTDKALRFLALVHGSSVAIQKARIVEKTLAVIRQQFGVKPKELVVGIGPGIQKCCYRRQGKSIDLLAMIFDQLIEVPTINISVADACTSCSRDKKGEYLFFSHHRSKVTQEKEGRFGAFVALKRN